MIFFLVCASVIYGKSDVVIGYFLFLISASLDALGGLYFFVNCESIVLAIYLRYTFVKREASVHAEQMSLSDLLIHTYKSNHLSLIWSSPITIDESDYICSVIF